MDVSKEGEEKRVIAANTVTFTKAPPKGSAGSALADMGTESKRRAADMADWEAKNKWKNPGTASGSASSAGSGTGAPPPKNQGKNQGNIGEISKTNLQNGKVFTRYVYPEVYFCGKVKDVPTAKSGDRRHAEETNPHFTRQRFEEKKITDRQRNERESNGRRLLWT